MKHGYGFCKNIDPIPSKWIEYKMEKNQIWKEEKKSGCFWPLLVWRGGYGVPRPVAPRDSALATAIIITVLGLVPHWGRPNTPLEAGPWSEEIYHVQGGPHEIHTYIYSVENTKPVAPSDSALATAIIITVLGLVPHFLVSSCWRPLKW